MRALVDSGEHVTHDGVVGGMRDDGMNDVIAEVMIRYELGDFSTVVRDRIAVIYRLNPPDAIARLQRAADYLGIRRVSSVTEGRYLKLFEDPPAVKLRKLKVVA
jgi:hypothetical protein